MVVPRGVMSLVVQGGASSGLLWAIRHGAYLLGGVSFKDKRSSKQQKVARRITNFQPPDRNWLTAMFLIVCIWYVTVTL